MLSIVIAIAGGMFGMVAEHEQWIVHPAMFHVLGFLTGYLSCGVMIVNNRWIRQ